jgi:hypothetical protein
VRGWRGRVVLERGRAGGPGPESTSPPARHSEPGRPACKTWLSHLLGSYPSSFSLSFPNWKMILNMTHL